MESCEAPLPLSGGKVRGFSHRLKMCTVLLD